MRDFQLAGMVEDAKRPVRNLAHKLGIKRKPTDEQLIDNHGPIVSYYGNQFDLNHPRCNPLIGGSIIKGSYEKMELRLIREYVTRHDRVVELGACMGVTSLALFDRVGQENHLVIEADRRNLALANYMFDLNAKPVRIRFGLLVSGGSVPASAVFSSNENASSSSQHERNGSEISDRVPALSFEDVLEEEQATALVLDIEGGEYDLLANANSFARLKRIILEAHPHIIGDAKMKEMTSTLNAHGFQTIFNCDNARYLVFERE